MGRFTVWARVALRRTVTAETAEEAVAQMREILEQSLTLQAVGQWKRQPAVAARPPHMGAKGWDGKRLVVRVRVVRKVHTGPKAMPRYSAPASIPSGATHGPQEQPAEKAGQEDRAPQ